MTDTKEREPLVQILEYNWPPYSVKYSSTSKKIE